MIEEDSKWLMHMKARELFRHRVIGASKLEIGKIYLVQVGKHGTDISYKPMLYQRFDAKMKLHYFLEMHIAKPYFLDGHNKEPKRRNHYWLYSSSATVINLNKIGIEVEKDLVFYNFFTEDYKIYAEKELIKTQERMERRNRRVML
jgi:hypothetical protein